MKMTWKMHRAKSLTGGGATCEFMADNGQMATVTIRGLTGTKAIAHLTAVERLLNGAIVVDGDDLLAMRGSVSNDASNAAGGPAVRGFLAVLS